MSQTLISLIDLTNFCNDLGYDVAPVKVEKGVKCLIFKDDKLLKRGEKVYKTWIDCQIDAYNKLYKAITK